MSFLTATNTELIYNMTGAGPDLTASTATIITPNSGGTVPGAYIPPVFSIWQPSSVVGKGFRVQLAGIYDVAAADGVTFKYSLDTTEGTQATTNPGVIASCGSSSFPSSTAGGWYMAFDIVFTAVNAAGNLSGFVNGFLLAGSANNAGTSQVTTGNVTLIGGSTSSGASTSTFTTWPATTAFWWELQATVATAPTHFAVQEHQIFGLN